jgi:hypothetical protein
MIPLTEVQNLNTDTIPTYSKDMKPNNRVVLLVIFSIIMATSTIYLIFKSKINNDEKDI